MQFDKASRGDGSLPEKLPCKGLLSEPVAFSHALCVTVFLCTGIEQIHHARATKYVSGHKNLIFLELCIHCPTGRCVRCCVHSAGEL